MQRYIVVALMAFSVFGLNFPAVYAKAVPETIYKWVQSSPRANYYFNMQQMCFAVDGKGMIDQNVLIVPTIKTYDDLQIQDVIAKRRWKMMDMDGYDDLSGVAEYVHIDLAKNIVTLIEKDDLDSEWDTLSATYPNQVSDLSKMSEKNLDHIFYKTIVDYAKLHKAEILKQTKGLVKPEDMQINKNLDKKNKNQKNK
ncbi:MAG: hypothetical protein WCS30_01620 [Selenomonadaceae bacterium]